MYADYFAYQNSISITHTAGIEEHAYHRAIPAFLWIDMTNGMGTQERSRRIFVNRSIYQWRPSELF